MTVQNPPDVSNETGTMELIGRVVPRWSWDGAREMAVRPPTPEPWSWAAFAGAQGVAPAPPPPAPVAPPVAAPAPSPGRPAPAGGVWAPLPPPVAAGAVIVNARRPLTALLPEPLLAFLVLAAGWALGFVDARFTIALPVAAAVLLLGAIRAPAVRPALLIGTLLIGAGALVAATGLVAVAWTLGWLGMLVGLLGIGSALFTRA